MGTTKYTDGSIHTFMVQSCEHSGDIERDLEDIPRGTYRIVSQLVCEGREVGFVAIKVLRSEGFTRAVKKSDITWMDEGNTVGDRVREFESM